MKAEQLSALQRISWRKILVSYRKCVGAVQASEKRILSAKRYLSPTVAVFESEAVNNSCRNSNSASSPAYLLSVDGL